MPVTRSTPAQRPECHSSTISSAGRASYSSLSLRCSPCGHLKSGGDVETPFRSLDVAATRHCAVDRAELLLRSPFAPGLVHEGREIIEAFRDGVAGLDETVGVFVTFGSEDFIVHVAVRDNRDLYAFVIDELTQRREVADVRTSVVYEHLREQVVLPLGPRVTSVEKNGHIR
ncbi:Lrp/AsnC ligand binding domain-containing protein [Rathayibacter tritici]|uniref:Lrp/AsnC ligand binding domain-containing protein n=1 Tax=Rathayibacter tritici TaxID=33888 RepID=UPI0028007064|nr:Lrp/AsnC ligand binding domain-containing protein [Rathayibacter tritici]